MSGLASVEKSWSRRRAGRLSKFKLWPIETNTSRFNKIPKQAMLRLAASRTTTAVAAHARASRACGSIGVTSSSASFSTSTPARNEGEIVSKFDLIKSVAEEHGLNNSQATRIVSGLFDSITEVSRVICSLVYVRWRCCTFWFVVRSGT